MKKKHIILEKLLLKFPRYADIFQRYLTRNNLGKFLLNFKKKNPINYVYDVGAFRGEWSNFYKKTSLKESDFFLFEANHDNEFFLKKKKFKYFLDVLSDTKKNIDFYSIEGSTGNSYYKENTDFYEKIVPIKKVSNTIDNIAIQNNLPKPDLIKLDTLGSELDILNGSVNTIENCKLIYIECPISANFNKNKFHLIDYCKFLENLGFIPQEICEFHYYCGYLIHIDVLFLKKTFYEDYGMNRDLLKMFY